MDLLSFLVSARFYPPPACRCTGYSMAEVLTTLAVAGVVVSSGVPAMQNLVHEQRLTTHVNELFGDLQLARSEAIKRVAQVYPLQKQQWLILLHDIQLAGRLDRIRGHERKRSGRFRRGDTKSPAGAGKRRDSALRDQLSLCLLQIRTAPPGRNATFTFCDTRGASHARAIIVWNTGRARVSSKSSSDGPLSCS